MNLSVSMLTADQTPSAIAVLADAFRDYPAMRFVLGDSADYDARLQHLITLFVRARLARGGPMLGVRDEQGVLAGVATITLPVEPEPAPEFRDWREHLWEELGEDARRRYQAFADGTSAFEPTVPHHHLNMIGVRPGAQGRGHSRRLLEAVHALAAAEEASAGVSLTTERAANITLYEHFGYRRLGHVRISDTFESWVMFRPHLR